MIGSERAWEQTVRSAPPVLSCNILVSEARQRLHHLFRIRLALPMPTPQEVLTTPLFTPENAPLPPGFTEADRAAILQQKKYERWMNMGAESCAFKTVLSGGGGARSSFEFSAVNLSSFPRRICHWMFLLPYVELIRLRGPYIAITNDDHPEDERLLQGYGKGHVEEWERNG